MTEHIGQQHLPLSIRRPSEIEQRLKAAQAALWEQERTQLLMKHPFTAKLALRLTLVMVVDSRLATACTDGAHVFINAHFAARCDQAMRRFVLAHEVWHCVMGHFRRHLGRSRLCWNLACDHEVNYLLLQEGLALPSDAVLYPSQRGRSAEQVYAWLEQHPRPEIDTPFDIHGHELQEITAQQAVEVIDPDFQISSPSGELAQQWQEAMVSIAQQCGGSLPKGLAQLVDNIVSPRVDWRTRLRVFLLRSYGGQRSWQRLNRRAWANGLYLPGQKGNMLSVMVAVDTSGSTRKHVGQFIEELHGLMADFDHVEIRFVECDAAIQRERVIYDCSELRAKEEAHSITLLGGGGTDFRPVFERAEEVVPQCLVYLTDGWGKAPGARPSYPVLWVIAPDGRPPVDWGEVIQMEAAA